MFFLYQVSLLIVLVGYCSGAFNGLQYYANYGGDIVLKCSLHNSAKWIGINGHQYSYGPTVLSSLPENIYSRLTVNETDEGYNLKIHQVEPYDVGQYICTDGNTSIHVVLYIKEPPSAIIMEEASGERIIANENSTIAVTCRSIGGQPPPLISMIWKNQLITSATTHSLTYTFTPTKTDDLSSLTCTSNHSMLPKPISVSAKWFLNFGPKSVTFDSYYIGYEGENKTFACRSKESRPPATFEWFLDGVPIKNWTTKIHETPNPDQTFDVISMKIIPMSKSLNGRMISCQAINIASSSKSLSQRQIIKVYYSPSIDILYNNASEQIKKRKFQCSPNGNPEIYNFGPWEHMSFQNEHIRYLHGDEDGFLTLPVLAESDRYQDSGIYICTVDNSVVDQFGKLVQSGQMSFHSKGSPQIGSFSQKDFVGLIEQNNLISVEVISFSDITSYTWYSKSSFGTNELLDSKKYQKDIKRTEMLSLCFGVNVTFSGFEITLAIKNMNTNDSGSYLLIIENDLGSTETTIRLKSQGALHMSTEKTETISVLVVVMATIGGIVVIVVKTVLIVCLRKRGRNNADPTGQSRSYKNACSGERSHNYGPECMDNKNMSLHEDSQDCSIDCTDFHDCC